jgi:hypothetical protein
MARHQRSTTRPEAALVDLETEIGRLYELPPEEFVTARDELWRRLRAADRDAAEQVHALRRPTVAAWAVNQVARRQPELVAELLDAGDKLRQAQRRALSGLRDSGLRTAAGERRDLLERLLAAAAGVLVEAGRAPEPHRDAVAASFQAASVEAEAAAVVRRGRLTRELQAPAGFGEVSGLELLRERPPEPSPEAARAPAGRRRAGGDGARRRELRAARAQLDDLRRRAKDTTRDADEARRAAEKVQAEADDVEERSRRLAEEARQARRAADDARRAAEEARAEAESARERAQRIMRRSRATAQRAAEAEAEAWSVREETKQAERRVAQLEEDLEEGGEG